MVEEKEVVLREDDALFLNGDQIHRGDIEQEMEGSEKALGVEKDLVDQMFEENVEQKVENKFKEEFMLELDQNTNGNSEAEIEEKTKEKSDRDIYSSWAEAQCVNELCCIDDISSSVSMPDKELLKIVVEEISIFEGLKVDDQAENGVLFRYCFDPGGQDVFEGVGFVMCSRVLISMFRNEWCRFQFDPGGDGQAKWQVVNYIICCSCLIGLIRESRMRTITNMSPQILKSCIVQPDGRVREKLAIVQPKDQSAILKEKFNIDLCVMRITGERRMVLSDMAVDLSNWREVLKEGQTADMEVLVDGTAVGEISCSCYVEDLVESKRGFANHILSIVDYNEDGTLSFAEFSELIDAFGNKLVVDKEFFRADDKDRDNVICVEELSMLLAFQQEREPLINCCQCMVKFLMFWINFQLTQYIFVELVTLLIKTEQQKDAKALRFGPNSEVSVVPFVGFTKHRRHKLLLWKIEQLQKAVAELQSHLAVTSNMNWKQLMGHFNGLHKSLKRCFTPKWLKFGKRRLNVELVYTCSSHLVGISCCWSSSNLALLVPVDFSFDIEAMV